MDVMTGSSGPAAGRSGVGTGSRSGGDDLREVAGASRPRAGSLCCAARKAPGQAPMLRIVRRLAEIPEVAQHVGQGIEVTAVLDLVRDDVGAGEAGDGAAQVRRQEVMDGPFPAA